MFYVTLFFLDGLVFQVLRFAYMNLSALVQETTDLEKQLISSKRALEVLKYLLDCCSFVVAVLASQGFCV